MGQKCSIIKTPNDFGGYWLKGMKNFKGHEGEPLFQASVYKDGKKIGFFSQDSHGGQDHLQGFSREDEAALRAFAKEFEGEASWGESYSTFLSSIADEVDSIKSFKRECKTRTLFVLKQDKDGRYKSMRRPYSNEARVYLEDRFKEDLVEIINECLPKA